MKNGFTLLELLVVMAIIGILSAIGIGGFQSSQVKARDARRKSDLKQISTALETFYNDTGAYPLGDSGYILGCNGGLACAWGSEFSDDKGTIYMVTLPEDSKNSRDYYYESDGDSYQLYALLENELDKDVNKSDDDEPQVYTGTDCGEGTCNYGISSSNIMPDEGHTLVVE